MTWGIKRLQGAWAMPKRESQPPSGKHILHKSHVKDRAGGHGEHHLPFPQVEQRGHKEGDGFRDTVISGQQRNILQAVHDEECEDSRWQRFPQITDVGGKRCPGLKKEKRKGARKHGGERAECDDDALLPEGKRAHQKPPFFSNGLRYSVMMRSMRPMAGKMKFSFPKRRRLPMEVESPMRAV